MQTQASRTWRSAAVIVLSLSVVAAGCGDSGSPVSPSVFESGGARLAAATTSSEYPVNAAFPVTPDSRTRKGLADALLHGPDRSRMVVLYAAPVSNPHGVQPSEPGFPPIPPPADRPATFTLWRFENGQFVGTLLAIRPDLLRG